MPAVLRRREDDARSALDAQAREEDVGVGVAEVVVDAPAGADDVLAVAAEIVDGADARLPVVRVLTGLAAELFEAGHAVEAARGRRLRQGDEVRDLRLVEVEAGDDVVAQAGVDGQPIGDAPVVLEVHAELLHRQVRR